MEIPSSAGVLNTPGICMCGSIRNNPAEVIELLQLPEGVYALTGLCVGCPAVQRPEVKPRLPLKAVLHQEVYSALSHQRRQRLGRDVPEPHSHAG